jgi:hypothetical protein
MARLIRPDQSPLGNGDILRQTLLKMRHDLSSWRGRYIEEETINKLFFLRPESFIDIWYHFLRHTVRVGPCVLHYFRTLLTYIQPSTDKTFIKKTRCEEGHLFIVLLSSLLRKWIWLVRIALRPFYPRRKCFQCFWYAVRWDQEQFKFRN